MPCNQLCPVFLSLVAPGLPMWLQTFLEPPPSKPPELPTGWVVSVPSPNLKVE